MKCIEEITHIVDHKLLKQSFLYTFIWGFLAHGYCFVNNIASHDALNNFYIAENGAKEALDVSSIQFIFLLPEAEFYCLGSLEL